MFNLRQSMQGRNPGVRPLRWWAESAPPPGWDRVKVSENLSATEVAPVAPADTSLVWVVFNTQQFLP